LLTTINGLELALRHPEDKEPLLFFIDQLYEYSLEHFRHEEALQLQYFFPFRDENKRGHDELEIEITRIRLDIHRILKKAELLPEDIEKLRSHSAFLAKGWLMKHILTEDLKMKGFMGSDEP
jgi:hemerythrin-like metal-binding protein